MLNTEKDVFNKTFKNGMKIKIYRLTDPDFRRLCGIELTDNEFTDVKVDDNDQVTNPKEKEEKQ